MEGADEVDDVRVFENMQNGTLVLAMVELKELENAATAMRRCILNSGQRTKPAFPQSFERVDIICLPTFRQLDLAEARSTDVDIQLDNISQADRNLEARPRAGNHSCMLWLCRIWLGWGRGG